MSEKRLTRSTTDVMIAGVCAGLADYFSIDPTIVRLLFVLFFFSGGGGLLLYIILWIVMPEAGTQVETPTAKYHPEE